MMKNDNRAENYERTMLSNKANIGKMWAEISEIQGKMGIKKEISMNFDHVT